MEAARTIAVLIPCHNEELTIGKVVDDFRAQLPQGVIYVFDNCCTDRTATIATQHGAVVLKEPRKGKGFVIEAMFDRVEADFYVMVDGDDTYPAEAVGGLLAPVIAGDADMAVGARRTDVRSEGVSPLRREGILPSPAADSRDTHGRDARDTQGQDALATAEPFRPLHVAGNNLVRWLINRIYGSALTDIMSGYRAFNRKVVRRLPVVSSGFEVETEMTIQMLYHRLKMVEVPVVYRGRPEGSHSKLQTFRDGARVLWKIFTLFRAVKPLTFFGLFALLLFGLGLIAGAAPIVGYVESGYTRVERFPLAILATGLMLLSAGSLFLGVLLHAVNWRFKELHNVMMRGRI